MTKGSTPLESRELGCLWLGLSNGREASVVAVTVSISHQLPGPSQTTAFWNVCLGWVGFLATEVPGDSSLVTRPSSDAGCLLVDRIDVTRCY